MDIQEELYQHLTNNLPPLKKTPSGWLKTNCPMCIQRGHTPDTRQRFGVKVGVSGIGLNCFNCGYRAKWEPGHDLPDSFRQLYRTIGLSDADVQALAFKAYLAKHEVQRSFLVGEVRGSITNQWSEVELPPNTKTIQEWVDSGEQSQEFLEVVEYAHSRKIREWDRVAWSPDREHFMRRRLLFPFTYKGKVVGYSGRMVGKHSNKRNRYHHKIPPHYVYNLDRQTVFNRKYTIVCEGVFDAFLVDGVATLHDKISEDQARLIRNLYTTPIVCPDRDSAGDSLVESAIHHGWSVSFPKWDRDIKDAAAAAERYGVVYALRSILANHTKDPDKIRVWRELDKEKYGV